MKYRVYSQHDVEPRVKDSGRTVLEVTRTDERVARDDARIIKEIIGRPSWVEEV